MLPRMLDGRYHVDGVRWGFDEPAFTPRFGDAYIDPEQVRDVYMVIEPFKPEWLASHSFLYFEFDPSAPVRDGQGNEDNGLVVSVEARLRQDQSFNLVGGMGKNFGLVYQIGTWTDIVQKDSRREGHKLIRYKLDLTTEQKKALLENSLQEATRDRSGEFYNTLNNSCFTNVVRQVNTVLPREQRMGEWILPRLLHRPLSALPNAGDILFGMHGVLADTPPVLTQPEVSRHADKQARPGPLTESIRHRSESPRWAPLCGMAGALAGATLGSMVAPPLVGLALGAVTGFAIGRMTGETLKRRAHTVLEPSEPYLAGIGQTATSGKSVAASGTLARSA